MKRFLSLTLVAIMLLTTISLTSCDLSALFGGGQSTTEPPKVVRTNITEMEWRKVYDSTNYELTLEAEGMKIYIIAADDVVYMDYMGLKLFIDTKTGTYVSESDAGYVGMVIGEDMFGSDMSLGGMGLFPTIEFSELVYDEQRKVYTYKNEDAIGEFQFEDGKLVYATVVPADTTVKGMFEIKNVGTTVLELPEYNDLSDGIIEPSKAGKDVVTTITDAQFSSFFAKNNYTIKANVVVANVEAKITDNSIESSASMMGIINSTTYHTLIDGEWYDIEEDYSTGDYVARKSDEGSINDFVTLFMLIGENLTVDMLTYNSEGRYYVYEEEGMELYLYFENGALVQFVVCDEVIDEGKTEVIFTVSNIGTTKVDLPEYTVYFDPNALTEEQWNEIMASQNFTGTVLIDGYTYDEEHGYTDHSSATTIMMAENGYLLIDDSNPDNYYYYAFDNGAVYQLSYNEETASFTAKKFEDVTPDMCTLGTMIDTGLSYSDFDYNEYLGEYYYYSDNGEETVSCTITFLNGEIVSMSYSKHANDGSSGLSFNASFDSVGTTELKMPEYKLLNN